MIIGEENLDFNYWGKHLPFNIKLTPWEKKIIREYFIVELKMSPDHQIDWESKQIKIMVDLSRFFNYNLS